METLRALIRGDLSPAGNPIIIEPSSIEDGLFDNGYHTEWVDSGTSALALALLNCKKQFEHIEKPQVIIPGYCCPDLVAAAVYAGVEPLLVDTGVDDASYDLQELKSAVNPQVIAIVAINFLGIKANLTEIRSAISDQKIKLIEDNAQWFPDNKQQQFSSDYIIFSFGRGKPLSLLGGGALLSKDPLEFSIEPREIRSGLSYQLKLRAYNLLLHPHAYCFLNRAPFLKLGETRLYSHEDIQPMSLTARALLLRNRDSYLQRTGEVISLYQEWCADRNYQLPAGMGTERQGRLLRFPLLLKNQSDRDKLYGLLTKNGLGASLLYQYQLNKIDQVASKVSLHSNLTNAQSFAQRLITLPVHDFVSRTHVQKIKRIFIDAFQ